MILPEQIDTPGCRHFTTDAGVLRRGLLSPRDEEQVVRELRPLVEAHSALGERVQAEGPLGVEGQAEHELRSPDVERSAGEPQAEGRLGVEEQAEHEPRWPDDQRWAY
jgi:hypothetical protein